jgi:cell division protein ZipA
MLNNLIEKSQHYLTPLLGIVVVILILIFGLASMFRKKKSVQTEVVEETIVEEMNESPTDEMAAEAIQEPVAIIKKTQKVKIEPEAVKIEEVEEVISIEPTEEDLSIAEAIAKAGEQALAASIGQVQQEEIKFGDESVPSWRDAVKESLQRRMQKKPVQTEAETIPEGPKEVFVFYVMAPRSTQFKGQVLLSVLRAHGLLLNEKKVFQYKDYEGLQFYVASAVNPGTFEIEQIHNFYTPGVSFILDTQAVASPKSAFSKMLEVISSVAEQLGGDVLDQNHQRLTQAGIGEYWAQIKILDNQRNRQHG